MTEKTHFTTNITIESILKDKLKQREQQGNLRQMSLSAGLTDFVSNDYLGLARSEVLQQKIMQEISKEAGSGVKNGSTGSRLLSGNNRQAEALEQKLAGIFLAEKSLFFNSGYSANLAILSSVPQKGDTIIYDERIHACLKDGARLSFANRFSFRHNDLLDLENKLQKASGVPFIVAESIYSMDGDSCPLQDMVALAKEYNAAIILDEAHSTGVQGERGSGLACSLNLQHEIFARVYTFGKAMGVHGACIAGSGLLIQYLVNFARSFIYTTAPPPHVLASVSAAFDHLGENMHLQKILANKVAYFLSVFDQNNKKDVQKIESNSAIQAVIVPGNKEVKSLAKKLNDNGFDARPILSPTVKAGEERLRICLHTFNTREEIDSMLNLIQE